MINTAQSKHLNVKIREEELTLLPERVIFWKRKNALLISDLHLGKSGHFRKAGIALPSSIHHDDIDRLSRIISEFPVQKLFLLGDLFHSTHNREWNHFLAWRKNFPSLEIHLIKGNHDILDAQLIHEAEIILHLEQFEAPPFLFVHNNYDKHSTAYILCGHIHPAIHFTGRAKQSATLPCFWFGKNSGVLPAFGNFTGNAIISPSEGDLVFFIVEGKVKAL
ncbi:MAG TPA: ligase-associated DNA damage response endonuclease PdeM [Chitinophagales bacterium]|nr:ligase-associated DNA damage response endonuclease PdeM [Chitinophagales bacterium]